MDQKIEFSHGKFLLTIAYQVLFCVVVLGTIFSSTHTNLSDFSANPINPIGIGLAIVFATHSILTTGQYIVRICKGYGCFSITSEGLKNAYYDTGNLIPALSPYIGLLPWEAIIRFEAASLPTGRAGHRTVIYVEVNPDRLPDDTPSGFRNVIKERKTALLGGNELGVGFYLDTHAAVQNPFVLLSILQGALEQNKS